MAALDARLLETAAARLVAATSRGEAPPPRALHVLATTAAVWHGVRYARGGGPGLTVGLVESLSHLGHAQIAAGLPVAAGTLEAAVAYRRAAPPPASDAAPLARDLAMLGAVRMMIEPQSAAPSLSEAAELHRALADADPQRWLGPLARCLLALAATHADQGRLPDARSVTIELFDVTAAPAPVDLDRDTFLRPLTALVDRIAPLDDPDPEVVAIRVRFHALSGV